MTLMKKLYLLLLCSTLALWSCSDDEEDILPQQQKQIEGYLTGSHAPRLVAEKDLTEGEEKPFYSEFGDKVYRYIDEYYNPDRKNRKLIDQNSKITITFRAYLFTGKAITEKTLPFFTNDPRLEQALYDEAGLTPGLWSFEPLAIDMAHPNVFGGLYVALLGCREQDEVEAYMTYNMAYGDDNFSVIPKESAVVYFFTVNSVE